MSKEKLDTAKIISTCYAAFQQVEAVSLSGSLVSNSQDQNSDLDLYVYSHTEIPVLDRASVVRSRADHFEIDNRFWEPGDEWIERGTGFKVDVMFRSVSWIQDQLDRVLVRHEASVGYSTCFWYNVQHSAILYDRAGWYQEMQRFCNQPYPEPLRMAIVSKNFPILEANLSSYTHQVELAALRNDPVSLNHRITAFLASYFDVLFAVNRVLHPGEKRLLQFARMQCPLLPPDMEQQVHAILSAAGQEASVVAKQLADTLEALLIQEGFSIPES